MRYILIALGIFLLYRFIVGFLLPVIKVSSQVRHQMKDYQQKMQSQQSGQSPYQEAPTPPKQKSTNKGDYIDFEEIK